MIVYCVIVLYSIMVYTLVPPPEASRGPEVCRAGGRERPDQTGRFSRTGRFSQTGPGAVALCYRSASLICYAPRPVWGFSPVWVFSLVWGFSNIFTIVYNYLKVTKAPPRLSYPKRDRERHLNGTCCMPKGMRGRIYPLRDTGRAYGYWLLAAS